MTQKVSSEFYIVFLPYMYVHISYMVKKVVSIYSLFFMLFARAQVGLLDLDICGPSIPSMLNITDHSVKQSTDGWVDT